MSDKIRLPNAEEIQKRLKSVTNDPGLINDFYFKIATKAGDKDFTAKGLAEVLVGQIYSFSTEPQPKKLILNNPFYNECIDKYMHQFIDALVDNKKIAEAAKQEVMRMRGLIIKLPNAENIQKFLKRFLDEEYLNKNLYPQIAKESGGEFTSKEIAVMLKKKIDNLNDCPASLLYKIVIDHYAKWPLIEKLLLSSGIYEKHFGHRPTPRKNEEFIKMALEEFQNLCA